LALYSSIDNKGTGSIQLATLTKIMQNADLYMNACAHKKGQISTDEFKKWNSIHLLPTLSDQFVQRMNKMFKLSAACQKNKAAEDIVAVFDIDKEDRVGEVLAAIRDVVVGEPPVDSDEPKTSIANWSTIVMESMGTDTTMAREPFLKWAAENKEAFRMLTELLAAVDQRAVELLMNQCSKIVLALQENSQGKGKERAEHTTEELRAKIKTSNLQLGSEPPHRLVNQAKIQATTEEERASDETQYWLGDLHQRLDEATIDELAKEAVGFGPSRTGEPTGDSWTDGKHSTNYQHSSKKKNRDLTRTDSECVREEVVNRRDEFGDEATGYESVLEELKLSPRAIQKQFVDEQLAKLEWDAADEVDGTARHRSTSSWDEVGEEEQDDGSDDDRITQEELEEI
jgi:hypothetical protein